VSQASVDPSAPTGDPVYIATLRMAVDLAQPEQALFSLPSGQSGNPCSPHYDDLLPLWRAGQGVTIPWTAEQIARCEMRELVLEPRR
jgi:penicillin amidase